MYESIFYWIMFQDEDYDEPILTIGEYNPKNPDSCAYMRVIGTDEMIPLPDKRILMMDQVTRGYSFDGS